MSEKRILKWTPFVVDVEATGPTPADYSMFEIGAVELEKNLDNIFHVHIHPINSGRDEGSLNSIGKTFLQICENPRNIEAKRAMENFRDWIESNTNEGTKPMFFSDNNGFDFMFTHWYFIHFLGHDPFGHTSRNISDIYGGAQKDMSLAFKFKKLRVIPHTHSADQDALGNAMALLKAIEIFNIKGII